MHRKRDSSQRFDMSTFNSVLRADTSYGGGGGDLYGGDPYATPSTTPTSHLHRRDDRKLKRTQMITEQQQLFAAHETHRDHLMTEIGQLCSTPSTAPLYPAAGGRTLYTPVDSPGIEDVSMMSISPCVDAPARVPFSQMGAGGEGGDVHMKDASSTPAAAQIIDLTAVKDEHHEERKRFNKRLTHTLWSNGNHKSGETIPYNANKIFEKCDLNTSSVMEHSDIETDKSLESPAPIKSANKGRLRLRKKPSPDDTTEEIITSSSPPPPTLEVNKPAVVKRSKLRIALMFFLLLLAAACYLVVNVKEELPLEQLLSIKHMQRVLREQLIGQHLAIAQISKAVNRRDSVLLFVGSPGIGKTYAADIMSRHYRTACIVTPSFPFPGYTQSEAPALILEWFRARSQNTSLFVFEDLHTANARFRSGLADALTTFTSNKTRPHHLFVFIGLDTHQDIAHRRYITYKDEGKRRDQITAADLVKRDYSYVLGTTLTSLVTDVVPFLPMEREQVETCIEREFKIRNIPATPENIAKIISQLTFYPPEDPFYCITGCRKVPIFIDMEFKH